MFQDKTIIITGASSGMGKATAVLLSSLGANCVLLGRNQDRLDEVARLCEGDTLAISQELSDFESYPGIIDRAFERFGPIYGLVHSAGIEQTILLQQLRDDDLKSIFEVNVFSAVKLAGLITKKKYRTETQSVVMIASVMGVVGNKALTSYSATKGALIAMVRSMALELAAKNVRVNAISPGHVRDSGMSEIMEKQLSDEALKRIIDSHPLGLGTCDDVARSVKFLLSNESRWMTGQNLVLDGGYSIQ
ncbi:MAG: SDR family oxidoreductase [Proteobacteria bacterium]|nr:MAG: SDR family oxidoreductase [Pseudomonadota bacterium]